MGAHVGLHDQTAALGRCRNHLAGVGVEDGNTITLCSEEVRHRRFCTAEAERRFGGLFANGLWRRVAIGRANQRQKLCIAKD
jgi:hypothetical protein